MRKVVALFVASGFLISTGAAFADADLFKRSNYMACHAVDQKRFGPALLDVAAKYKDDTTAVATLDCCSW